MQRISLKYPGIMQQTNTSTHWNADMRQTPMLCFSKVIMIYYIALMLKLCIHIQRSSFHSLKDMKTIVGNKIKGLKKWYVFWI